MSFYIENFRLYFCGYHRAVDLSTSPQMRPSYFFFAIFESTVFSSQEATSHCLQSGVKFKLTDFYKILSM